VANSILEWLQRWQKILWEPSLGLALVVGIGIRLVLIPWFSDPYNFWAAHLGTKVLLTGKDPFSLFASDPRFAQLGPWPYPAEYFLFALTAYEGSGSAPILFGIWLRIPAVAADAGISILLLRIMRQLGGSERLARTAAIAYLFNPFTILVTAIWGENDPIAVFFTVLALHFLLRKTDRDVILGSFTLGLGIATKVYPSVFLPMALALVHGIPKKLKVLGAAALAPALTSAPFLLYDARSYLGVVFGFSGGISGSNRGQLDPQFTAWREVSWFTGPLDSSLAFVAAGGLVLGLAWTYTLVRNGKLDLTAAHGFVILLSYLLAVRWSPNYFLWALPFVTLHALRHNRGAQQRIALGLWVPAFAYALIYNGWYPDAFSGASGLSYWTLISGVPGTRAHESLPPELAPFLTAATVAVSFFVALLCIRPVWSRGANDSPPTRAEVTDPQHVMSQSRRRLVTMVLSVTFVALFATFAAYQSSHIRPVNPTDFALFDVLPDGSFVLTDQFRADILSFRWVFHGSGQYSLHPNGTSGILFDTAGPNGTAYIENDLAGDRISIRLTFRLETLYGTERLVILRANSTWFGVIPAGRGAGTLTFFDQAANRSVDLGSIGVGWNQATIDFSPLEQRVEAGGVMFTLPPAGSISAVDLGHTDPISNGGGRFAIAEVVMQWSGSQRVIPKLSPAIVLLVDFAALVPLLLVSNVSSRPKAYRT